MSTAAGASSTGEAEEPGRARTDEESAHGSTEETMVSDDAENVPQLSEGRSRRSFGEVLGEIFLPVLPALIGAGILQGLTSLGLAFGVLQEEQNIYWVLTTITAAVFYFLPFLLGVTSARAFGTSPYLAIAVVAFFLHPDVVALMAGDRELSLFGLPVVRTTYTSSVIQIIIMIWGMSFIHRGARRIVPQVLRTVLLPPLVLAVTVVAGLLVLGPIGAALTSAITAVLESLNGGAPWLVPVLIGTFGALMVSVGLSFTLFPIALTGLSVTGADTIYGPGMLASNMALAGMAVAVAIRAKDSDYRSYAYTAGGTALLGVAQPALYGAALLLRRPLIAVMSGGLAGGLVAGLTGFRVFGFIPAGLTAVPVWLGGAGWANPLSGAAVCLVAFAISFVVAWLIGYEQPRRDQVEELAA